MSKMYNNVTADMFEIAESLSTNSSVTNATYVRDANLKNSTALVSIINMGYISRILPSVVAMSILFALSG